MGYKSIFLRWHTLCIQSSSQECLISFPDWISNVVMARQGFARMGFAACFGAPLFSILFMWYTVAQTYNLAR